MSLYGLFLPLSAWIAVEALTAIVFGWPPGTATHLLIEALRAA